MIIDHTYFIGKINLPQTGNTVGRTTVNGFIEVYEPEYLQKAMGYSLWKAFTAGIGAGSPLQKWLDIRDGKEFVIGDVTYKWPGFTAKPSPISQYVYFRFMENQYTITSTAGESTPKFENGEWVANVRKMVQAWNEMVRLSDLLSAFLYANKDTTYTEWQMCKTEIYIPINEFGI